MDKSVENDEKSDNFWVLNTISNCNEKSVKNRRKVIKSIAVHKRYD